MKKNYFLQKTIISAFALTLGSSFSSAQCVSNYLLNGTEIQVSSGFLWGQGFNADCSGNLEYVEFISFTSGTVSAGTLKIYDGNTVLTTPIYTQAFSDIVIATSGDPIRVNLNSTLQVVSGSTYTFEFFVDNVNVLADVSTGGTTYTGGSAFQSGAEVAAADFDFNVSIENTSNIQTLESIEIVNCTPNPTVEHLTINGLKEETQFHLIDITGKDVMQGYVNNGDIIDVHSLKNGVYVMKFSSGYQTKIIKN